MSLCFRHLCWRSLTTDNSSCMGNGFFYLLEVISKVITNNRRNNRHRKKISYVKLCLFKTSCFSMFLLVHRCAKWVMTIPHFITWVGRIPRHFLLQILVSSSCPTIPQMEEIGIYFFWYVAFSPYTTYYGIRSICFIKKSNGCLRLDFESDQWERNGPHQPTEKPKQANAYLCLYYCGQEDFSLHTFLPYRITYTPWVRLVSKKAMWFPDQGSSWWQCLVTSRYPLLRMCLCRYKNVKKYQRKSKR